MDVRRLALLLVLLASMPAFGGELTGRVTDATARGLPGVLVESRGGSAVTDANGEYALDLAEGRQAVTFRLLGFAAITREVDVPSRTDVRMTLEASEAIVVTGKSTFRNLADIEVLDRNLIGIADTASSGVITAAQIDHRALSRPGDVLETVPGVVISQHSGEGKANQYYLRGFNLDHGTDLATTVAGAPVNMPTHAHGQGYSDANFLIPELISGVQYKKGPYYADEGDFASAGAVNVNYVNWLEAPVVSLTTGRFGYQRALAAGSRSLGAGFLLGAFEVSRNDGPWTTPDDFRKLNALLRYTGGGERQAYSVTLSGYDGRWSATDQVPSRAVDTALISRFGTLDPSDGGETHRYALTGEWQRRSRDTLTRANAYAIDYGLDLFSNFTYFLDDPENGDQFEQRDERVILGGRLSHQWMTGRFENRAGVDLRHDRIGTLGLYRTRERTRLSTIREDSVRQSSLGAYVQSSIQLREKLRVVAGLRADAYRFDVATTDDAAIVNPKLNLILGPWRNTELYVSAGGGFHSNDGRSARDSARVLARTRGAEVGLRTMPIPRLQTTIALWALDMDSELVFVGDAGTTEASHPSRRVGVEWTNYWRLTEHILVDADLAYSKSRFRNGDRIPGAVEGVVAAGIAFLDLGKISGSLRARWLGPRPLLEDDTVRSKASSLVFGEIGYAITPRVRIVLEGLNLLNSAVSDVDYVYTSRLPHEPAEGVTDVHTHPVEPRSFRLRFETSF